MLEALKFQRRTTSPAIAVVLVSSSPKMDPIRFTMALATCAPPFPGRLLPAGREGRVGRPGRCVCGLVPELVAAAELPLHPYMAFSLARSLEENPCRWPILLPPAR